MASVVPNSTVWLMKNVPLDVTYTHTLWFDTESDQRNTFLSNSTGWIIQRFEHQMYKRINSNTMRLAINAEQLHSCNYMCFINGRFNSDSYPNGKMFYAFVTEINYVSDMVTEVQFQIDVMQSYLFDYEMTQCFIERIHTPTDDLYEHTMPEPVGTGEYLLERLPEVSAGDGLMFNNMGYFVASTSKPEFSGEENDPNALGDPSYTITKATPDINSGILVGTYTQVFYLHDEDDTYDLLVERIAKYLAAIDNTGYSDGVINIFCAPLSFYYKTASNSNNTEEQTRVRAVSYDFIQPGVLTLSREGGGDPDNVVQNSKCYSYPYNFMLVTSSDGTYAEYKYELSETAKDPEKRYIKFNASGTVNSDGEFMLRPIGYRNYPSDPNSVNYEDVLTCTRTPLCSWNSDSYKCWLAQHKSGITAGVVSDSVSAIGSFVKKMFFGRQPEGDQSITSQVTGARETNQQNNKIKAVIDLGVSAVRIVSGVLGTIGDAKAQPNTPRGDTTGVMDISNKTFGFRFYHCFVKPEYMATIDDFFTRFGYAVMWTAVPTRKNRSEFTYVKTQACEIKGTTIQIGNNTVTRSVNSEVAAQICAIYDHGITFWVHWENVGDYFRDNDPLPPPV